MTHLILKTLAISLMFISLTNAAVASEEQHGQLTADQLHDRGFRPLFNGSSLEHWKMEPGHAGHWVARDGIIDYDGNSEQTDHHSRSLWTNEDFQEVQLYVEWRLPRPPELKQHPIVLYNADFLRDENGKRITRPALDAGDSGILFRGNQNCQANIWSQELGSGEINGYRVNRSYSPKLRRSCIPLFKADNPLGEWNVFLLTLQNDSLTVELNGQLVLQSEPLPDLPATGPIGLQHHGDPVQFREIWVKELDRK